MNISYIYQDKPLFGLDIGFSSMKVMQLEWNNKKPRIVGYGVHGFDSNWIRDGVIEDPEALAKAACDLFDKHVVGDITTRRVALSIPASRTFSRVIKLPRLNSKELTDAVRTEAEQYIPVPVDQLYIDHDIIRTSEKEIELFAVAVPKKIIDSYASFAKLIGLEAIAMATTTEAAGKLFVMAKSSGMPAVLIDFGSVSTDITIFDKTLVVTGTVSGGGDNFSKMIADKLGVTREEANVIKTKYGMTYSKKQREIKEALSPFLTQLLKEVRRMIRYYEERYGSESKIGQVVTMGGGANMPGLSEYLTDSLRLPVTMSDPWQYTTHSRLQPPSVSERSMYVTVCGLALTNPKETFA